jgi:hypothetical protein
MTSTAPRSPAGSEIVKYFDRSARDSRFRGGAFEVDVTNKASEEMLESGHRSRRTLDPDPFVVLDIRRLKRFKRAQNPIQGIVRRALATSKVAAAPISPGTTASASHLLCAREPPLRREAQRALLRLHCLLA